MTKAGDDNGTRDAIVETLLSRLGGMLSGDANAIAAAVLAASADIVKATEPARRREAQAYRSGWSAAMMTAARTSTEAGHHEAASSILPMAHAGHLAAEERDVEALTDAELAVIWRELCAGYDITPLTDGDLATVRRKDDGRTLFGPATTGECTGFIHAATLVSMRKVLEIDLQERINLGIFFADNRNSDLHAAESIEAAMVMIRDCIDMRESPDGRLMEGRLAFLMPLLKIPPVDEMKNWLRQMLRLHHLAQAHLGGQSPPTASPPSAPSDAPGEIVRGALGRGPLSLLLDEGTEIVVYREADGPLNVRKAADYDAEAGSGSGSPSAANAAAE